jgi:hypothetical protein
MEARNSRRSLRVRNDEEEEAGDGEEEHTEDLRIDKSSKDTADGAAATFCKGAVADGDTETAQATEERI